MISQLIARAHSCEFCQKLVLSRDPTKRHLLWQSSGHFFLNIGDGPIYTANYPLDVQHAGGDLGIEVFCQREREIVQDSLMSGMRAGCKLATEIIELCGPDRLERLRFNHPFLRVTSRSQECVAEFAIHLLPGESQQNKSVAISRRSHGRRGQTSRHHSPHSYMSLATIHLESGWPLSRVGSLIAWSLMADARSICRPTRIPQDVWFICPSWDLPGTSA